MSDQKQPQFVDVVDATDMFAGTMKRIEVGKEEVLVANHEGKIYAMCDRCSHMNAPLSMGSLNGKVVTCPMHAAKFDVTTGKKLAEPAAIDQAKFPEPMPESVQKLFANIGKIMSNISTYDQPTYETRVEGGRVKIGI